MKARSSRSVVRLFLLFGVFAPAFLVLGADAVSVKARSLRFGGTLFIVFATVALVVRVFGGNELSLIPWPVALIVIAIGAFLLKQGLQEPEEARHA